LGRSATKEHEGENEGLWILFASDTICNSHDSLCSNSRSWDLQFQQLRHF
jgi:hypothetical protein